MGMSQRCAPLWETGFISRVFDAWSQGTKVFCLQGKNIYFSFLLLRFTSGVCMVVKRKLIKNVLVSSRFIGSRMLAVSCLSSCYGRAILQLLVEEELIEFIQCIPYLGLPTYFL